MFNALRRCPAAVSRSLSSTALLTRTVRLPLAQSTAGPRIAPLRLHNVSIAGFHQSAKWQQAVAAEESVETLAEDGPVTEFQDLATRGLVHPNIVKQLTQKMKLTTMTDVQTRTINEALSGVDVIAQAKTGTGKTLGFLIPVVQRILQTEPSLAQKPRGYKRARADDIRAIVMSPTRELAEQIAVEAKKVTEGTGIVVQTAVGGTQKAMMLRQTQREGCHLLIATPGRLYDILSDEHSGIKAPRLAALVLDEADRLLDSGFKAEIDQIRHFLPDPEEVERQNLMFSATIPRDVVNLVRQTLRPGFHYAKCVNEDEAPTHERVPQRSVQLAGFENTLPALYEFVTQQIALSKSGEAKPFKAIVYLNSTAEVTLAASVFYKLSGGFKRGSLLHGMSAEEIHAKLSQAQRSRASESFRTCKSGILFSTDVTARGMDFPNVSHVIQIGLPRDRETYIHRIGRTGRAGKEGEGWIFLSPLERKEVSRRLKGLDIKDATTTLQTASIDMTQAAEVPESAGQILQDCAEAHKKVYPDQLEAAFRGLFGSYQWLSEKRPLIEYANQLAEFGWGMNNPPPVPSSVYQNGRRGGGMGSHGGFGDRRSSRSPFENGGSRDGYGSRDRRGGGFGGKRSGGFGGERRSGGFGGERRSGGFGGDRREGGEYSDRRGGGFRDRSERVSY